MLYLTREDSVERLPLSTRTSNCLRRAGIHTVGQLLDYPEDGWKDIRNMGKKSTDELTSLTARIRAGDGFLEVASKAEAPKPSQDSETPENPPLPRLPDIPLRELGLSVRAYNRLDSMGVRTAADLSDATMESLLAVKSMGKKTATQIMEKLEKLREEFSSPSSGAAAPAGESGEALYQLVKRLAAFTSLSQGDLLRLLASCRETSPAAEGEELLDLAFQQGPIRREARRAILRLLEQHEEWVSLEELRRHLPSGTSLKTTKLLLGDLLRREQITLQNNRVRRRWPTVLEYAKRIPDQRQRELLLARLGGATLEETGQRFGITRERVRQLSQKALAARPRLYEDQYQFLFHHYEFSRKEFLLAFDEPEETYHYLEMVRPKGERRPIRELLEDENIPIPLRRRAERVVYKQYVTIGGVRVLKKRPELTDYLIRTRCRETTSMEEFLQLYQEMLDSLGLGEDPSLVIEARTYENKFNTSNHLLWIQGRRFRYYPIPEQDFAPLLETLDLERYEDMEISTLKLFRDYPELMKEYDIRDEYELHNLLKKIWPKDGGQVRFKKMPTIEIGTPDRDRQVLDLLLQYAPLSNTELAQRYEEAYGVKSATVLANYFSCIDPYFHGGVYRIDQPPLPEEQQSRMEALLTGDFYSMTELRQLYRREFPDSAPGSLNPFVLKSLGFHPYERYVVSTRYSGATDYFRHLLTDTGVVDMTRQNHRYTDIKSYWAELNDLKARREIVEFLPLQYISLRRLQSSGVDAEALEDYGTAACVFTRPGEYFTVASLRREGFSHPLDDLGFDEWFYSSLLAEDPRFSYRRMGKNRLFRPGQEPVYLADFLRWLVEAEPLGYLDIYDLQQKLERQYGISLPLYKLTEVVQGSELYYDTIMETVYIDYDTYLEEI